MVAAVQKTLTTRAFENKEYQFELGRTVVKEFLDLPRNMRVEPSFRNYATNLPALDPVRISVARSATPDTSSDRFYAIIFLMIAEDESGRTSVPVPRNRAPPPAHQGGGVHFRPGVPPAHPRNVQSRPEY